MSTSTERQVPTVVNGPRTAQTPGMVRLPGVAGDTTGASRIWIGHVTGVPNETGPPHHHAEAETSAYILKGRVRVYYGDDFKEFVEAGPGDFLFVPAHTNHIEAKSLRRAHGVHCFALAGQHRREPRRVELVRAVQATVHRCLRPPKQFRANGEYAVRGQARRTTARGGLHQKSFQGEGVLALPPALGGILYLGAP